MKDRIFRVNPKQFGARLRILRDEAGLSQAELARRLKVNKQTISSWETGHRTPNFVDVVRIASILGKNVDDFAAIPEEIHKPEMGRPKRKIQPPTLSTDAEKESHD